MDSGKLEGEHDNQVGSILATHDPTRIYEGTIEVVEDEEQEVYLGGSHG